MYNQLYGHCTSYKKSKEDRGPISQRAKIDLKLRINLNCTIKLIADAFTLELDLTLIPFASAPVKRKFHTARVKGQLSKVTDYAHTGTHAVYFSIHLNPHSI